MMRRPRQHMTVERPQTDEKAPTGAPSTDRPEPHRPAHWEPVSVCGWCTEGPPDCDRCVEIEQQGGWQ